MPDATLENYLELVRPSVDNRITVYEKKVTYNGLKGISVKYAGEISQIPIIYYQTILENNGTKYQILTWCAKSSDGQDLQTWLEFVYNSFKTLK